MLLLNILGNLGKDAEIKNINGKDYLSFSVASTEKKGDQEVTTWISVLAGNNPNLLPYLRKGQQVFVSGRMTAGIYQSQNSFDIDLSVFAQTLQLCGGKREESQPASSPVSSGSTTSPTTPSSIPTASQLSTPFPPRVDENGIPKQDDSDLPF